MLNLAGAVGGHLDTSDPASTCIGLLINYPGIIKIRCGLFAAPD